MGRMSDCHEEFRERKPPAVGTGGSSIGYEWFVRQIRAFSSSWKGEEKARIPQIRHLPAGNDAVQPVPQVDRQLEEVAHLPRKKVDQAWSQAGAVEDAQRALEVRPGLS